MKAKPIVLIILFVAALVSFYWVSQAALPGHQNAFDKQVIEWRRSFITSGLVKLTKVITFFGDRKFLLPAYCLVVGLLLIRRKYAYAIIIACAGLGAGSLDSIFKEIYQRSRPELQAIKTLTSYSFPSGHALASFVFGCVLIFIGWQTKWRRQWKWLLTVLLFLCIIAIGFSRVILNVHYATDVVGGFLLGLMWVITCYAVLRKVMSRFDN